MKSKVVATVSNELLRNVATGSRRLLSHGLDNRVGAPEVGKGQVPFSPSRMKPCEIAQMPVHASMLLSKAAFLNC